MERSAAGGSRARRGRPQARLQGQGAIRDHDAVFIGIAEVPRHEPQAGEFYRNARFAVIFLGAFTRMGCKGFDAKVDAGEIGGIAHAAKDDRAVPAVLRAKSGEVVAEQRPSQRTTAVDHKHAAIAGFLECGPHQRVVFEGTYRREGAVKAAAAAEIAKDWFCNV